MTLSPETLAAFADGQLDSAEAADVARAVDADPALARQVERHRALRARLAAHYAPVLEAPLPDRLRQAVMPPEATVVDLAQARARRTRRLTWGGGIGLALAASLTLAVVLQRPGAETPLPGYADGALASALDNQLSGQAPVGAPVRVVISFADASGALCRGYASGQGGGIACRDDRGWKVTRQLGAQVATPEADDGAYRQAGSHDAALMALAQDMAQGAALDQAAERAARAEGWRKP